MQESQQLPAKPGAKASGPKELGRSVAPAGLSAPIERPGKPAFTVGFILMPTFTLMAFTGFVEMLRLCGDEGDASRQIQCAWTVMNPTLEPIESSCGLKIMPWEELRDPRGFDYIVVVGGLLRGCHPDPRIYAYLRQAAQAGVALVGLCTGSFVLARAGLMKGRNCCVHWYHYHDFTEEFSDVIPVTDNLFLVDNDRITCAGGTAAIDLAAYLIERHIDKLRAMKGIRHIVLDWARSPRHTQLPFVGEQFDVSDLRVRQAVRIMEENISGSLSIIELARRVNLSLRQLDRRFRATLGVSPGAFLRVLRLKRAEWLLTNTSRPITQIAFDCGFSDGSHLSRLFRRAHGAPPASVRREHAARAKPAHLLSSRSAPSDSAKPQLS